MNKRIIIFIFIFIFIFIYSLNEARGETPYKVSMISDKMDINSGEEFTVTVYLPGYGSIEQAKYYLYFDKPLRLKQDIIFGVPQCMSDSPYPAENAFAIFTIIHPDLIKDLLSPFKPKCAPLCTQSGFGKPGDTPGSVSPPFEFTIKVEDNAKGGDNEVEFVFSYTDGKEWRTIKETLTIHVNSRYEKNQEVLTILGITIALLGIFFSGVYIESLKKHKDYIDLIFLSLVILLATIYVNNIINLGILALFSILAYKIIRRIASP